jgi:outer membrane protein assembly factor BamA
MLRNVVGLFLCLLPFCLLSQNPSGMLTPPGEFVKDTSGQTDLIKILSNLTHIHLKKPPKINGRKVYYSLLPVGTSVPGGGTALVTTTQAGFYLGDRKSTYLSNVTFSPSTNFKGAFNFPIRSNIWSPNNKWNFEGDIRYSFFPLNTWGIGGNQPEDHKLLIDYSYVRFYFNALKKIEPYLFAGIGYNLDYQVAIDSDNDSLDLQKFTGYKYGTANHSNSFTSGITFNLLYDSRVNSINPLPGVYANIVFRVNPKFMGSNDSWHSLYTDVRKYIPLSPLRKGQNVLALWTYLWTTFGSPSPYLDLPATGWDSEQRSGRGIYNRRYTGKTLWYMEAEYRKNLSANGLFGFVVFANLNTVTEPGTHQFSYPHPAGGTGLRIKFNKYSGTNLGIDFGISKEYKAVYFSLGEAF